MEMNVMNEMNGMNVVFDKIFQLKKKWHDDVNNFDDVIMFWRF